MFSVPPLVLWAANFRAAVVGADRAQVDSYVPGAAHHAISEIPHGSIVVGRSKLMDSI